EAGHCPPVERQVHGADWPNRFPSRSSARAGLPNARPAPATRQLCPPKSLTPTTSMIQETWINQEIYGKHSRIFTLSQGANECRSRSTASFADHAGECR